MPGEIRAGVGTSTAAETPRALREAAEEALAGLPEPPAAALLFATPEHAEAAAELLADARILLGTREIAGATVQGLIVPGLPGEAGPALGVAALVGVEAHAFLLDEPADDWLPERADARPGDLAVVLADPAALASGSLLGSLEAALAPALVVGAGAVEGPGGAALQWAGDALASGGVAGLLVRAPRPARVGVTQSCLPASDLLRVTRSRGHWIMELDGRPALDVYREVARGPLAGDLRRASAFVMAALPRSGQLDPRSYVVRNVVGFDTEAKSFAVADSVGQGELMALAVREPEAARADLKQLIEASAEPRPALALYFDCLARGAALFGHEGLEAGYLGAGLAPAPVLGVLGAFEIGPVGAHTELLTYTGVLALLDR